MKKKIILGMLLMLLSLPVSAQVFYFDVGFGLGKGWTEIEGRNMVDVLKDAGLSVSELTGDIGVKAGYGPFGNMPLYVVGEFGGMGHKIYDTYNYIQFNFYIIGPGVIFYPIPLIQLGLSAGYSFVVNQTDIAWFKPYDSKGGFAWNISAAIDFGKKNYGCLIGLKYFNAANKLVVSNGDEKASMIGAFVRYTRRKKTRSFF